MGRWTSPLAKFLIPTDNGDSWQDMRRGQTGIPCGNHPGAFGFVRKNHVHEGIDLYCEDGADVFAVEDGFVVAVLDFTGERANPPSPWWNDTQAVMIEGASGVVLYGEIKTELVVGDAVRQDYIVGSVVPVLKKDKGRPMSMLHLELHKHGTRQAYDWPLIGPHRHTLLDPTPHLLRATF